MKETLFFIKNVIKNPRQISSIVPSSKFLAKSITKNIKNNDIIIELGPGIGIFTKEIIKKVNNKNNIFVIEMNKNFIQKLKKDFKEINIIHGNAIEIIKNNKIDADKVISGLPLLSMNQKDIFNLIYEIFNNSKSNIELYQFTYGIKCPIKKEILNALNLKSTYIQTVFRNIPPASIYKIEKNAK